MARGNRNRNQGGVQRFNVQSTGQAEVHRFEQEPERPPRRSIRWLWRIWNRIRTWLLRIWNRISSWWSLVKEYSKTLCLVSVVFIGIVLYIGMPHLKDWLSDQRLSDLMKPMLPTGENVPAVCPTIECKQSALTALAKMNTSMHPCEDFYNFACGWFVENRSIPDDKVEVTTLSVVSDLLRGQLLSVVSEEIHENEIIPFMLSKNLYNMCMNTEKIEEQDVKPLLEILDSLGGWPVLKADGWNSDDSWSWTQSMKHLRMQGYSTDYFFKFSVGTDWRNTNRRIIYVDQASLYLSREHLLEGRENYMVSAYYNSMVEIAESLGVVKERAERELSDSLDFEIALAKISVPIEKRRDVSAQYNPMSVKDFQSKYRSINWVNYFNALLKDTDILIDENERIIVRAPEFMEQLIPLLEETPKRTLANYVMQRVIRFSSPLLTKRLQKRKLQFSIIFGDKNVKEDRPMECADITASRLPISVGALYVRKYFNEESMHTALDMVNRIQNAFLKMLPKVDWMDEITRNFVLKKMNSLITHVGYPDEFMIDSKIIEYYKGLTFKPEDNFLKTILYLDKFATTKAFKKLRQPVNKADWTTYSYPAIANARYSLIENRIQLTAGILQGQFFSDRRPQYMNYGAIGSIIGHELTHVFDDQGRQYDKNGNLADWWQPDTEEDYQEKALCMIDQYDNYTEPNMNSNLNGINTLSENIADNVGLQRAYYAYQKWAENNQEELPLPDLNLPPKQMFWLSAAQARCSVYRWDTMWMRLINGSFSPDRFRVVGSMSNLKEFSQDFNCPLDSPMNPREKCKVW